jgi:hypothetical protein
MKTSNILLIVLFSFTFLALLGSNMVLTKEYDKIDKNDPLYGFNRKIVQPFKYVKLEGKAFGLTEIHPGKSFEILTLPEKRLLDWRVTGDTLVFIYKRDWELFRPFSEQDLGNTPTVVITAPEVRGIIANNVPFSIKNWKSADMFIRQIGGALLLGHNTIENLTTDMSSGGYAKFDHSNNLGNVAIQVKDSSSLKIEKDVFKSFKANVDAAAHIDLPGNLYENP